MAPDTQDMDVVKSQRGSDGFGLEAHFQVRLSSCDVSFSFASSYPCHVTKSDGRIER